MNVAENPADPTEEEVAAVLALLAVRAAGRDTRPEQPQSGWAAYWRTVKAPIDPGPGKWQAAVRGW